jgi:hypothetical protein
VGDVAQELVTLSGQEHRCGRSERCEFLVAKAEDRWWQGSISL